MKIWERDDETGVIRCNVHGETVAKCDCPHFTVLADRGWNPYLDQYDGKYDLLLQEINDASETT